MSRFFSHVYPAGSTNLPHAEAAQSPRVAVALLAAAASQGSKSWSVRGEESNCETLINGLIAHSDWPIFGTQIDRKAWILGSDWLEKVYVVKAHCAERAEVGNRLNRGSPRHCTRYRY